MGSFYAGHSDLQAKSQIFQIEQFEYGLISVTIMRENDTKNEINLIELHCLMNVILWVILYAKCSK